MEKRCDLHSHSNFSDGTCSPTELVWLAQQQSLLALALTDHNTARNAPALIRAAKQYDLTVLPGMELTTEEEAHVVCLFPALENALAFSSYVYERLLPIKNKPDIFGHQYICDEDENIKGEIEHLLINATSIGFSDVSRELKPFGGVMIPAHVDKTTTSIISNLGFIPPDSDFKTFECKNMANLHQLRKDHPYLQNCKVITDSDAHYLEHINEPVNTILVKEKSIEAILEYLNS